MNSIHKKEAVPIPELVSIEDRPVFFAEKTGTKAKYPIMLIRKRDSDESLKNYDEAHRASVLRKALLKLKARSHSALHPYKVMLSTPQDSFIKKKGSSEMLRATPCMLLCSYDFRVEKNPLIVEVDTDQGVFVCEFSTIQSNQPAEDFHYWYLHQTYGFNGETLKLLVNESSLTTPLPVFKGFCFFCIMSYNNLYR